MLDAVHIGRAAELAGVTVDTVRFYQKLGVIKGVNRTDSGYRLFDGEQIQDLKFVRHAQELGFTLAEIKELLALRRKHHACSTVQSMLTRKLADVREKVKSLTDLEADLAAALRKCNRELRLEKGMQHEDCCPLLAKLESNECVQGSEDGPNQGKPRGK